MILVEKSARQKPNLLGKEKSPYLLQHAFNPVDWYPWNDEAFKKAAEEDKPVFLSIGYSTCHWCHVMAHDSFEDEEVAALLNEDYIAVKVDREERPDLDQQYMAACQALTGQGGWPLTVFLTPDRKPFYAGTFFPKESRYGISGMLDILPRISEYWKKEKGRVVQAADELVNALNSMTEESRDTESELDEKEGRDILHKAYKQLKSSFDREYAGFGGAPKFPAPHQLLFLLRYGKGQDEQDAVEMVRKTIQALHRGGIFDQLGYGIHRYSVDREWLVPHFEKMLYDQAMTLLAAVETYQLDGDAAAAEMARKIAAYLLREMQAPEGAFYAAEDADSEGEEGTYYVWKLAEMLDLFGEQRGQMLAEYYGVTAEGNFEKGLNVLNRRCDDLQFAEKMGLSIKNLQEEIAETRTVLLAERAKREKPFLDDKVVTAWNGLAIAALARAGKVLGETGFIREAERAAAFIAKNLVTPAGKLLRRYRDKEAAIEAFLDDYAAMTWAYLELYRATGEQQHLDKAVSLNTIMLDLFLNQRGTLNYSTELKGDGQLPFEAEAYDGASPSGYSMAVMNQFRLGRLLQDEELNKTGDKLIAAQLKNLRKQPTAYTYLLSALDYRFNPADQILHCPADGSCEWE